jgi:anthranilate synthase component 1
MRVTCKDGIVAIEGAETKTVRSDKPLAVLRELLSRYKAPRLYGLPPFAGGFVGYFAYSMIGCAEPVLKLKKGDADDFDLMLFDKVIAYDHLKQKICVIVNMKTDRLMENYGRAVAEIESIVRMIREPQPVTPDRISIRADFTCNVTKEEYCAMVEKTKEYIVDGDIFQAVISRRFESPFAGSLLEAYRVLRTTNPSPYMVFMRIDDMELMSTSPETLVRLQNGRLATFPVAGSRPRGRTEAEDIALKKELLSDEKELSEHNMLVDLARNDLGRISKYSSVKVMDYMMIHRYSKIMHIASRVESDIREDCDALDAIEAILPAGTLSGAPKIRACEIIEELEGEPRGIYGGALGYIDFTGNLDTCIAIRMAVKKDGKVTVQAGGGIVADSVPETEYEESANKAGAVMSAIINACEVNG